MRVLHVVKTSEGALWAARQAAVLTTCGVDIDVVVPRRTGAAIPAWEDAGARLHVFDVTLSPRRPHWLRAGVQQVRALIGELRPDLIHSHFVNTTCLLRLALGRNHPIPRIFQVAGPLHLEHWWTRKFEIGLAGEADVWIGSSHCINEWYRREGVADSRLFLSYWGFEIGRGPATPAGILRKTVGASADDILIGNVSWMYPPKRALGQTCGMKCHEDIIAALAKVCRKIPHAMGVFVGTGWDGATWYEEKLRRLAARLAGDRIRFAGPLPAAAARQAWRDIDLAVHVPLSENCGGVIEPLHFGVPVIASAVGGIPEVIIADRTGWLVPPRNPDLLATAILRALSNLDAGRHMASTGKRLVDTMFDVERTAREVLDIYRHVLDRDCPPPVPFDAHRFLEL